MGSRSVIDLLLFMLEQNGSILLYVGSEISPNVLECGYVGNVKNEFSHANLCLRPKVCRQWKGMVIKMD